MKMKETLTILAVGAAMTGALAGCSDDNDPVAPMPADQAGTTFTLTIENVSEPGDFFASGVFAVPVGAASPAPIGPGGAYEFSVGAEPGSRLSFATMFVHSNDLFYAPSGQGIALFNPDGTPRQGDVTREVMLWDAGTEANEQPGVGANQAPHQAGPDTGPADPDMTVRLVNDGFDYPATTEVIRVTLAGDGHNLFTVRIENVSDSMTLQTTGGMSDAVPLAPGVFVVHQGSDPLFTSGTKDMMTGLEALAEDGSPDQLATGLSSRVGQIVPLAPGIAAVHAMGPSLFRVGITDGGHGLEALAEDGDPSGLIGYFGGRSDVSFASAFMVPDGAAAPSPIGPGQTYSISFVADMGDRLSFATMFVQSNDLFYAFDPMGHALFAKDGTPQVGDLTGMVRLWDSGTERNEWPGAGPAQAPRQGGPDTGAADPNRAVRTAADGFPYPATDQVIRVTLSVEP
ncbi:MAG: spondin domain-containing protein [bacterium]